MARARAHSEPGPSCGEIRFHDCAIPARERADTRNATSSVMPGVRTCLRHRVGMHAAAPGYAAMVAWGDDDPEDEDWRGGSKMTARS